MSVYPIIHKIQCFIQRLLYAFSTHYRIEVEGLFEAIKDLDYVVIKLDTPNTHQQFPKHYKIGTDIDIVTTPENISKIKNSILNLNNFKKFKVLINETEENHKVRFQFYKFLNIEFDILSSVNSKLNTDCLNSIMMQNTIKIPSTDFEIVYRAVEYQRRPLKKYHLEFIRENKNYIRLDLLEKYKVNPDLIKILSVN